MTEFDPVEFGRSIGAMIREAVEPLKAENAELRKEIEALKAREPDRIETIVEAPPVEIDVSDVVKELLAADEIKQLVALEVEAYLTENPPPPGKDGKDGEKGEPGEPGKSVTLDDVSVFLEAAVAKHVLDFERRASEKLDRAIERIPVPKDGRDGVDLTELSLDYDGERTVTVPLWRGYWSPGVVAERGDILTHNGTAYIAIVDNPKCEPGVGKYDHEWKVFARKGRDGRDGRNGIDKTAPVKVNRDDE
jgi:hypothetical protein